MCGQFLPLFPGRGKTTEQKYSVQAGIELGISGLFVQLFRSYGH